MHQEAHVVGFRVGHETYGIPIAALHEIVRVPEITAIPDAAAHIEGVINLRGKIVAVVDLRKRFGTCASRIDRHSRILVVGHQGRLAGLVVDAASEVIRIPASEIETATALMQEGGLDCVTGLGKYQGRLIILLDVDKVLNMRDHSSAPGAAGAESGKSLAQSARAGK
ncbi:MAG: chemotaxis protein CheW [Terriglobales bacterium]|jgi:purine-binding chemotaxis protein CheW